MAAQVDCEAMNRVIGRLHGLLADGFCPFVYHGERPVGFLLSLRKSGGPVRILTLWTAEAWRRKGVTAVLFNEFAREAERQKMTAFDASQIREDNLASRMSVELAGGRVIRRYRRYEMMI